MPCNVKIDFDGIGDKNGYQGLCKMLPKDDIAQQLESGCLLLCCRCLLPSSGNNEAANAIHLLPRFHQDTTSVAIPITVTGNNIQVLPALESYVASKLEKNSGEALILSTCQWDRLCCPSVCEQKSQGIGFPHGRSRDVSEGLHNSCCRNLTQYVFKCRFGR